MSLTLRLSRTYSSWSRKGSSSFFTSTWSMSMLAPMATSPMPSSSEPESESASLLPPPPPPPPGGLQPPPPPTSGLAGDASAGKAPPGPGLRRLPIPMDRAVPGVAVRRVRFRLRDELFALPVLKPSRGGSWRSRLGRLLRSGVRSLSSSSAVER